MLRRSLSTYAGGSPRAISDGSNAQVFYFVDDATHDIALLGRLLREARPFVEIDATGEGDNGGTDLLARIDAVLGKAVA